MYTLLHWATINDFCSACKSRHLFVDANNVDSVKQMPQICEAILSLGITDLKSDWLSQLTELPALRAFNCRSESLKAPSHWNRVLRKNPTPRKPEVQTRFSFRVYLKEVSSGLGRKRMFIHLNVQILTQQLVVTAVNHYQPFHFAFSSQCELPVWLSKGSKHTSHSQHLTNNKIRSNT